MCAGVQSRCGRTALGEFRAAIASSKDHGTATSVVMACMCWWFWPSDKPPRALHMLLASANSPPRSGNSAAPSHQANDSRQMGRGGL